jgi:hypothetical protein
MPLPNDANAGSSTSSSSSSTCEWAGIVAMRRAAFERVQ